MLLFTENASHHNSICFSCLALTVIWWKISTGNTLFFQTSITFFSQASTMFFNKSTYQSMSAVSQCQTMGIPNQFSKEALKYKMCWRSWNGCSTEKQPYWAVYRTGRSSTRSAFSSALSASRKCTFVYLNECWHSFVGLFLSIAGGRSSSAGRSLARPSPSSIMQYHCPGGAVVAF